MLSGGGRCESLQPDDLPVPPRQTLFFSATWPKEVQSIARQLCRNDPVRIFVGAVQVITLACFNVVSSCRELKYWRACLLLLSLQRIVLDDIGQLVVYTCMEGCVQSSC